MKKLMQKALTSKVGRNASVLASLALSTVGTASPWQS